MKYYHIDKNELSVISGPHDVMSPYIKKLTSCGNPDLIDLSQYDLVPLVYPSINENQYYTSNVVVYIDRVEQEVGNLTTEEINQHIQLSLVDVVQRHLDTTAQQRNYDNILSLCTYATSSNPTFAAEGQAGVTWRDAVWTYCYQVLDDVNNNIRPIPTEEELINELPQILW